MAKKLTPSEADSLKKFVKKNGGQIKVSLLFNIAPVTLSRTSNRRTGPSPLLIGKLFEHGIVKEIKN